MKQTTIDRQPPPTATNTSQRKICHRMPSSSSVLMVMVLMAFGWTNDVGNFGCDSFTLSPTPIKTLLVDSAATAWSVRRRQKQQERRRQNIHILYGSHRRPKSIISTSRHEMATKGDETWSKTGGSGGSRLGVRRRVRRVLDKARKRTGVANDSDENTTFGSSSGASILSETASLGLFDDSVTEVVLRAPPSTTNGATQTYPRNDTVLPLVLEETPYNSNGRLVQSKQEKNRASGTTDAKDNKTSYSSSSIRNNGTASSGVQVDALLQAATAKIDPLPFTLPQLSDEQRQQLREGERIQEQSKMGREGSGFVVMDIPSPAYAIWECLLDFEAYPDNIGTVRSMRMFTNTHLKQSYIAEQPVPPGTGMETRHYGMASISRAAFTLSKFRLKIAAIHRYQPHPDGHYMVFTLDKACTNAVLQDAKGIWYTQENPEGRQGFTRIWLLCELKVSPMLPKFIVDYAAKRAMPRATTWLRPTVERFCEKWFGSDKRPR